MPALSSPPTRTSQKSTQPESCDLEVFPRSNTWQPLSMSALEVCTLYNIHCILYIIHYTLYIVLCTFLLNKLCTLYIVYYLVHTLSYQIHVLPNSYII